MGQSTNDDSARLEEFTDINKNEFYPGKLVISPNNKAKIAFDILVSMMELIEIFYISYILSFHTGNSLISTIFLPFFIFKIILSFFQGYVQDIVVVSELSLAALKYLRTKFVIDLVATIPFYFINIEYLAFRLIRILTFSSITSNIIKLINAVISPCKVMTRKAQELTGTSVRIILYLFLILHLLGCCLRLMADLDDQSSWLCQSIDIFPGKEDYPYTQPCDLSILPNGTLYVACLYVVMMTLTTVGYGDYSVKTINEYIFMMVIELIGIGFFGYLMGRINRVVALLNTRNDIKKERKEYLESFLLQLDRANKKRPLNASFIEVIWQYFDKYWTKNHISIQDGQFFKQIPPKLQNEMVDYLFQDFFVTFRYFFEDTEKEFARDIAKNMRFTTYQKFPRRTFSIFQVDSENVPPIIKKGQEPHIVVFVLKGSIQLCNSTGSYRYLSLGKGSFYGEGYVLFDLPSSYGIFYNIDDKVQVLEIDAQCFKQICNQYPYSRRIISQRAIQRRVRFREKKQAWIRGLQRKLHESLSNVNVSLNRFQDTPAGSQNRKDGRDTTNVEFGSFDGIRRKLPKIQQKLERDIYDEGEAIQRQKEIIQQSLDDPNIREELTFDSDADEGAIVVTEKKDTSTSTIDDDLIIKRARDVGEMLLNVENLSKRMDNMEDRLIDSLREIEAQLNIPPSSPSKRVLNRRSSLEGEKEEESNLTIQNSDNHRW